MKNVIIFFAIFYVAASDAIPKDMEEYRLTLDIKYRTDCIKESKVDKIRMALIEKDLLSQRAMTSEDRCYLTCMIIKSDILTSNGYLSLSKITKGMTDALKDKIKKDITKCHTYNNYKEKCLRTVSVFNCVINRMEGSHKIRVIPVFKAAFSY